MAPPYHSRARRVALGRSGAPAFGRSGEQMATVEELEDAVRRVNALAKTPSTDRMLELYGLYKQATSGDVKTSRPGMFDVKGRAKWDAWSSRKGMTEDAARTAYVALAALLAA